MAYWCFNPRARVGRDEMRDSVINKVQAVSIHAPAWGATQREGRVDIEAMFQSTRPRGARLDDVLRDAPAALFQSTRPRGARLRTAEEGYNGNDVSIHAPAWGATPQVPFLPPVEFVSIHAPAWGATPIEIVV